MRKIAIAGLVVGLLAVMAGPVLAAVIWEWHTGDTCLWIDSVTFNPACNQNGITISNSGWVWMSAEHYLLFDPEDQLTVQTTCPSLEIHIVFYPEDPFEGTPAGYAIDFRDIYNTSYPCLITEILIDDGVIPPAPDSGSLLDNFAPTGIFATASDLIGAMMGVAMLIAGIALGFRVLGWLIASIR